MSELPPPPPPLPPIPVQVLSYTEPMTGGRPGAITTMGVMSIIFGSLGIFTSIFGAFMSLGFLLASAAATSTFTGPPTPSVMEIAGPKGFNTVDRQAIVKAFQAKQPMSPRQTAQLEFLLADVGTTILPSVPLPIAGLVSDPSVDYQSQFLTGEAGANPEGGVYYAVPVGKITLTNDDATFTPANGASTPSFTRAAQRSNTGAGLNPAEVKAVMGRVQESAGTSPLNAKQLSVLAGQLTSGVSVGYAPDMPSLLASVRSVRPQPDGSQVISFPNGTYVISPTGSLTMTVGATTPIRTPFPKMKTWPLATLMIEGVLSIALSLYLLIIGIVTLRNSLTGGRLHRVYAWVKIILVLAAAAATWGMIADFSAAIISRSAGVGRSTAPLSAVSTAFTIGSLLVGLAYPVTILLILRARSVKEFYSVK